MAFGQASGPPASGRQVKDLLRLLENAGHADFRDARGPMGFTQRQAGGKFTADEAQAFIDQLEQAEYEAEHGGAPPPPNPEPVKKPAPKKRRAAAAPSAAQLTPSQRTLRAMSDENLRAEAERRGWTVTIPD